VAEQETKQIIYQGLPERRLDHYLAEIEPGYSRNQLQKAIRRGDVRVNGAVVKTGFRLSIDDKIKLSLKAPASTVPLPEEGPLDILYRDEWMVVLNKPAGLVMHPAPGRMSGTLLNRLLFHFPQIQAADWTPHYEEAEPEADAEVETEAVVEEVVQEGDAAPVAAEAVVSDQVVPDAEAAVPEEKPEQKAEVISPLLRAGIIHRLDKDTSGVLVVGLSPEFVLKMQTLFRERLIRKNYHALVFGVPRVDGDLIDMPMGRHPHRPGMMDVVLDGRKAETEYHVLRRFAKCSLLEVYPRTGRTHQVRLHLWKIGHPVVADKLYRSRNIPALKDQYRDTEGGWIDRQALHAKSLKFIHPETGKEVFFEAPYPADFAKTLSRLEKLG